MIRHGYNNIFGESEQHYKLLTFHVKEIPEIFVSIDHYLKSYITPLVEETHADLLSNVSTVSQAPALEVVDVKVSKDFKPPKGLYYNILLKRNQKREVGENSELKHESKYEPEVGDLIALTDVRPRRIEDLNRPKRSFLIARVQEHTKLERKNHFESKVRAKVLSEYALWLQYNLNFHIKNEEHDDKHSSRNKAEAFIVAEIVANHHKEYVVHLVFLRYLEQNFEELGKTQ
ncbi:hypothetical protein KY290_016576 [Solanum tuberosum]|uniref:Uncharacterized protein n=1 Tax=Solanum tuberosum TaxID=4113 RepID=A0ABQ7V8U5_SOLTU|nr:hypothetical protein KY284_015853 [Solanum tuberosum]KAH0760503.1 hypothetical protein KY290_016576 [Solanum tuberosum]